jgi:hypothetical protein
MDSLEKASAQTNVADKALWIPMMLIAITAWSFHTVCKGYAAGKILANVWNDLDS